ncbi:replication initiation protein [Pseudoalteromonas undina]|uniref:replication initiation protein n=1 Tax=Pseudoalteromonas undina TaxID=43660 RepID=UPI0018673E26|nr:RepB family plasmid replication initiator protein [Pseudoalteromonas undina]
MTGETVVYKNELNLVPLRDFTSTEINLFFSMCNKLKEKDTDELKIPFVELKHLSSYEQTEKKRFINDLKRIYDKVLNLTYTEYSGLSFKKFVLFTAYEVNADDEYLTISVNDKLKNILNELTGDFTKFELEELTHIKSTYSKNMYRLLKQYRHTGYYKIHIDDFRERLDVPKSYRMTNVNTSVLKPIIKELSPLFENLKINKIKAKKGRKIEWLEFVFSPERRTFSKKQPQSVKETNKGYRNREKTPEWIFDDSYSEDVVDDKLDSDRKAFLDQLKQDWED